MCTSKKVQLKKPFATLDKIIDENVKMQDKTKCLRFLKSYVQQHKQVEPIFTKQQYKPILIKPKTHTLNIPYPKSGNSPERCTHPMKLRSRQRFQYPTHGNNYKHMAVQHLHTHSMNISTIAPSTQVNHICNSMGTKMSIDQLVQTKPNT